MKVKALKDHSNAHGQFKKGETYDHRNPQNDIHFGIVEAVKEGPAKAASPAHASEKKK